MNRKFTGNPFDDLYTQEGYLSLKRSLFNYKLRKRRIGKHVPSSGLILDVGSGVAPVSPDLERTILADISEESIKSVDLPVREKFVMSVTDLSFMDGSFDCVLCSEVLEHVEDDTKAITELRRVLKPGGTLVITVPFLKKYWGEDDEYVGHKRRYEPGELEGKLREAGFTMIDTHKLSGRIERFLTRVSLRYYLKNGRRRKLPIEVYKAVNTMIFVFLLIAESSLSWEGTTRILVVAR